MRSCFGFMEQFLMLSRLLCSNVQREGIKLSPDLASGLFYYVPLHKIWHGIHFITLLWRKYCDLSLQYLYAITQHFSNLI